MYLISLSILSIDIPLTRVTLHVLPEVACATESTVTDGTSADGTSTQSLGQLGICGGE